MDIKGLRGFLIVAFIAQLARPAAADSYEVTISREQHQRFINAARVWQEPQADDVLSSAANGSGIIDAQSVITRRYTLDQSRQAVQDTADRTIITGVIEFT